MGSTKSKNNHLAVIDSISTLNILPNECLILILEYLDISDLSAVADCSSRFRSLARYVFSHRYKTGRNFMWKSVERTVPIFGDLIRSVHSIPDPSKYLTEVNVIAINQSIPKLKKLDCILNDDEILNCSVWEELIPKLNILKLRILTTSNKFDYGRINYWNNLVMLNVNICLLPLDNILHQLHCPSIKYLKLHGNICDAEVFEQFAQRNVQLKILSLYISNDTNTIHLTAIKFLQNLETLRILFKNDISRIRNRVQIENGFSSLYNELVGIHSLQKLYLGFNYSLFNYSYRDSIMNIKQLKVLHMSGLFDAEFYNERLKLLVNNMPNLEELRVFLHWGQTEVVSMLIENNPRLKCLYIGGNGLTNNKYMRLVKMCKNKKRRLKIIVASYRLLSKVQALHEKFSHVVLLSSGFTVKEFEAVEHEILNSMGNSLCSGA